MGSIAVLFWRYQWAPSPRKTIKPRHIRDALVGNKLCRYITRVTGRVEFIDTQQASHCPWLCPATTCKVRFSREPFIFCLLASSIRDVVCGLIAGMSLFHDTTTHDVLPKPFPQLLASTRNGHALTDSFFPYRAITPSYPPLSPSIPRTASASSPLFSPRSPLKARQPMEKKKVPCRSQQKCKTSATRATGICLSV